MKKGLKKLNWTKIGAYALLIIMLLSTVLTLFIY